MTARFETLPMPRLTRSERPRFAFYGPMASGKTWCANYLWTTADYDKFALADKLKALAYDIYGLTGKDGAKRQFLQEFGDFLRTWDNDIFVKHLLMRIKTFEEANPYSGILVDDVRYLNEAKILKRNGFKLVRVDASYEVRHDRIEKLYPNFDWTRVAHKSELEWEQIVPDYTIRSETQADAAYELEKMVNEYSHSLSR